MVGCAVWGGFVLRERTETETWKVSAERQQIKWDHVTVQASEEKTARN